MQRISSRYVLLFTLLACLPCTAWSQPFAGIFAGDISGTPSVLTLVQRDSLVEGLIDAQGYRYSLSGTAAPHRVLGRLTDPQTDGSVAFDLTVQADTLALDLLVPDSTGSRTNRHTLTFHRTDPTDAVRRLHADAPVGRDSALVGLWYHDKRFTDDGWDLPYRVRVWLCENGTYVWFDDVYGSHEASPRPVPEACGAVPSGPHGHDAGLERGEWRTHDRVLYARPDSTEAWVPYGRYHANDQALLLTHDDGSRELWHRQQ